MHPSPRRALVVISLSLILLGVFLIGFLSYGRLGVPIAEQVVSTMTPGSDKGMMSHTTSQLDRRAAERSNNVEVPRSNRAFTQSVASGPTISPKEEAERLQNHQAEALYRGLKESSDPQEKRNLRKQLAALKPGHVPFRFAIDKYESTTSDEEKLHLQSILAKIDVSDFTSEVADLASQTTDVSLFVSLAYALRHSRSIAARQELLNLAANNQLPSDRTGSVIANQGSVALHRCLLDSLQPSDLAWINAYRQTNQLNALQEKILDDFVFKTERAVRKP